MNVGPFIAGYMREHQTKAVFEMEEPFPERLRGQTMRR